MLEPSHLELDEFYIECEIRDIDRADPKARDLLRAAIMAEFEGKNAHPTKLHTMRSLTAEIGDIDSKITIIDNEIKDHLDDMGASYINKLKSRLLHLKDRVMRIQHIHPSQQQPSQRLLAGIDRCLHNLDSEQGATGGSLVTALDRNISSTPHGSQEAMNKILDTAMKGARQKLTITHDDNDKVLVKQLKSSQTTQKASQRGGLNSRGRGTRTQNTSLRRKVWDHSLATDVQGGEATAHDSLHYDEELMTSLVSPVKNINLHEAIQNQSINSANFMQTMPRVASLPVRPLTAEVRRDHSSAQNLNNANFDRPYAQNFAHVDIDRPTEPRDSYDRPRERNYGQIQDRRPQYRASSPTKCLKSWNLKFDGSKYGLPVEEFLFRVESLASIDSVPVDVVAAHIHEFLHGKASQWYWLYRRLHHRLPWRQLRGALLAEFRSQETDYEIRQAMHSRKQKPHESFGDFD